MFSVYPLRVHNTIKKGGEGVTVIVQKKIAIPWQI